MLHPTSSLKGFHLVASDAQSIGHLTDVYFDSHEWVVRYLVVNTGSWLLGKEVLISPQSLDSIDVADASIAVSLSQEKIKNAPEIDTQQPVSRQQEISYNDYYGIAPYSGIAPRFGISTPAAAMSPVDPALHASPAPIERARRTEAERGDFHLRSAHDVTGHTIHGSDDEIGRVSDFLVDDRDWSIRYFVVDTAVWFGKKVVVPTAAIREVSWDQRSVYLTIPREQVQHAPEYDADTPRLEAYEKRLAAHYDLQGDAATNLSLSHE